MVGSVEKGNRMLRVNGHACVGGQAEGVHMDDKSPADVISRGHAAAHCSCVCDGKMEPVSVPHH